MSDRKISRKSFGGARLISIKNEGEPWDGCIWVKDVKSIKEFDALSQEEQDKCYLERCPRGVQYRMNFPTEYPYVQTDCKERTENPDPDTPSDGCPFLFRYANNAMWDCRLVKKDASKQIYYDKY